MHPMMPTLGRPGWKLGLLVLLRTTLSVSALFAAYFLIPTRRPEEGSDLPWLILELGVFAVIVAIQVPAIVKAKYPILRAVESMAVVIPLYLLIFARIYLSSSLTDPSGFSQPLNDVGSLYFTVTVFSTVGFGDIAARSEVARLVVASQMLLDLVILGLGIQVFVGAVQRGRSSQAETPDPPSRPGAGGPDR